MSRATEIYAREFDSVLFSFRRTSARRSKVRFIKLGSRLADYPHQRLTGRGEYRLRVGDYRVIYEFDRERNILNLIAVGNRREIYR